MHTAFSLFSHAYLCALTKNAHHAVFGMIIGLKNVVINTHPIQCSIVLLLTHHWDVTFACNLFSGQGASTPYNSHH